MQMEATQLIHAMSLWSQISTQIVEKERERGRLEVEERGETNEGCLCGKWGGPTTSGLFDKNECLLLGF